MLRLFKRQAKSNYSDYVAASFANNGLCIAAAKAQADDTAIDYLEFFPSNSLEQQQQTLKQHLQQHWQQPLLSINLNPGQYQLVNLEPPEVQWSEMRSAIQWSAKDMLDHNVDELYLDVFAVPDDAFRQQKKMIYVAALQKQYLHRLITPLQQQKINTAQIGIAELNLCATTGSIASKGALAMLIINAESALLNITVAGQLYLTRLFRVQKFNISSLPALASVDQASDPLAASSGAEEAAFADEFDGDITEIDDLADDDFYGDSFASDEGAQDYAQQLDGLLLDLQRSLDFFESQIGKGQVQTLVLATSDTHGAAIGDYLSENLSCRLVTMPMHGLSHLALDRRQDFYRFLPTIGACLKLREGGSKT